MVQAIQQPLLDALRRIDRPGTYCTSGLLPPVIPGLEVAGAGTVALPLEERQAAAIQKVARRAPYGKGTQTLVDTNVRRVWEIDAAQVTLANPEWQEVLQIAVNAVQAGLGLERQPLETHLYKLLLYEPGSFFLSHRDGEKLDRMVATLVIALPSPHKGGELVVRHEGHEESVDFSKESRFQTQYAAFYADCEHEIRPVTSGFRLALVYNLTLAKSERTISAPTSRGHIDAVASLLCQWSSRRKAASNSSSPSTASKLAVLLDHRYTEAGLTRDALKGVDRSQADVLFAAARESGCDASLALVTYWESGSADPSSGYGSGSRRRRGYGRYDDEYGDESAVEHVMDEVIDSSLTAQMLPPLIQAFLVLEEPALLGQLVMYVLDRPQEFDLTTVQVPALLSLETWLNRTVKHSSAPLQTWLAEVLAELNTRKSQPPREPADWRRESDTGCDCTDCQVLTSFLKDPDQKTLRLPLAERRRQHIHQVIDHKELDTTHDTERKGRPYSLVCTKTQASYERALKAHRLDLDHLAKINQIQAWHDELPSDPARPPGKAQRPKKRK